MLGRLAGIFAHPQYQKASIHSQQRKPFVLARTHAAVLPFGGAFDLLAGADAGGSPHDDGGSNDLHAGVGDDYHHQHNVQAAFGSSLPHPLSTRTFPVSERWSEEVANVYQCTSEHCFCRLHLRT